MTITSTRTGSSGTPVTSVDTTFPTIQGRGFCSTCSDHDWDCCNYDKGSRTSSSGGIAATSTPSGAGKNANREFNVMLGLGVVLGGLVALMAWKKGEGGRGKNV